jgi:hypothetical protein
LYRQTLGHHTRAFVVAFLTFWMVLIFASLKYAAEVPEGMSSSSAECRLVAAFIYLFLVAIPLWRIGAKARSQGPPRHTAVTARP